MKKSSTELRYLLITRTLAGGGAERFVSTFASYMADQGYDVHVLTYERSDREYPLSPNVTRHVMPFVEDSPKGKVLRILRMAQSLMKIKPDVVIPFIESVVLCTYLVNLVLRKKFVFTVRNSPWHAGGGRTSERLRGLMARTADAIMLQNREQAEYFPASYRDRIYIVPNPVADKFLFSSKEIYAPELTRLTAVGRLHPQKNFPLLMRAVKDLQQEQSDIFLRIYGEGDERAVLEDLIAREGLSGACSLMGRTADVDAVLKETDLFVMSSDYEGMPNALIEAMATGVPCISSDCRTGPRSLIRDGQTGLLFQTGSLDSLKEKMTWALGHPGEMNRMGRAAREDIMENCQIEKIMVSFLEMIEGMYGKKHG